MDLIWHKIPDECTDTFCFLGSWCQVQSILVFLLISTQVQCQENTGWYVFYLLVNKYIKSILKQFPVLKKSVSQLPINSPFSVSPNLHNNFIFGQQTVNWNFKHQLDFKYSFSWLVKLYLAKNVGFLKSFKYLGS